MKQKIGIMGFSGDAPKNIQKLAFETGRAIAKADCILITGATTGIPLESAKGAKQENGQVLGISPASSKKSHKESFHMPTDYHDAIIYTGMGYIGRNAINIRTSDAIIIINGGAGTLNEFSASFAEGRPIGVLQGTGGITDLLPKIQKVLKDNRRFKTPIIYDEDPKKLVQKLIEKINEGKNHEDQDRSIHPLC